MRLTFRAEPPPAPRGALLFESGGLWRAFAHDGRTLVLIHEDEGQPPTRGALVTPDWSEGELFVPPSRLSAVPGYALSYPLDELAFRDHAAWRDGFVVHAAAILLGGRAYLFVGHSGAGKSTVAELWQRHAPEAVILSDDRVMVRAGGRSVRAWGTPWHGSGKHAHPGSAPLDGLFLLEKAEETRITRLDPGTAAGEVFARSFVALWDAGAIARVLETVDRVVQRVPVHRLALRPDAAAIGALRELIGA